MCFRHLPNVAARIDITDRVQALQRLGILFYPDRNETAHVSLPYVFETTCPAFAVEVHQ